MKRIFALLLASVMLFTACGSSETTTTAAGNEGTSAASADGEYVFVTKGVNVVMNAEAEPIVKALGGNPTYFESESCAFKGLDKQYDYGSFIIYTYPKDDVDYILQVELKDDTVEAEGGLCIGSAKADVEKALGAPTSQTNAAYTYERGKSQLMFVMENDAVTSIQYLAVTK